jgi:antitoxin component of RelBE/YafQ-DinJ toxin-antitoxin module
MKKDSIIKLRLTEAEKAAAEREARAWGVTVSELIREMLAKMTGVRG